jgi:hypothetical protein
VLRSADLVGAVLAIRLHGSEARIRINSVSPDPTDRTGQVLLHAISIEQADGKSVPMCDVAPDGTRAGFPLAGRSLPDGTLAVGTGGEFEVVCTSGAQAKCVRLGYHPWARLPDGSPTLPLFNACIRMVRADYAGKGQSETRDGTLITIFDRAGIHPYRGGSGADFEAGWDEQGAVCVRHPRIQGITTLHGIESSSPRLAGRVGAICTAEKARALGAVIFDSSSG